MAEFRGFATTQELELYIKSLTDDVVAAKIHVPEEYSVVGENVTHVKGGAAFIELMNGRRILIPNQTFEKFVNEGLFTKMRIPVQLVPIKRDAP